jgi:hypothetical protein
MEVFSTKQEQVERCLMCAGVSSAHARVEPHLSGRVQLTTDLVQHSCLVILTKPISLITSQQRTSECLLRSTGARRAPPPGTSARLGLSHIRLI